MGTDKALLPWPPASKSGTETFLSAAIHSLSLSTDFVLVVAGENETAISPVVYAQGASLVVNPDPERGQFSSLQVGLHEILNRGRDTALITLVDRPPTNTKTVQILIDAFAAADDAVWAVVPEYTGRHGHPYIAGRELIEAFLQAPVTSTAREVERQNQARIQYVQVEDPSIAANINTPEDYAALIARCS